MPLTVASPLLAPVGFDVDVYVVLDDFGSIGRSYRETAEESGDRESLIRDLMGGQYNNPVRIVCFNTARGTSRDATSDIAQEIQDRVSRARVKKVPRDFATLSNGNWTARVPYALCAWPFERMNYRRM